MTQTTRYLLVILLLALGLRLIVSLSQSTDVYAGTGGDSGWYLANGLGFFSGREHGQIRGVNFYISTIPTAPLYLIFVGTWQTFLSDDAAIHAIRIAQSLMSTATIFFAFRLALTLSQDQRAGLLAALALALHPVFIADSGHIMTETLYIFLVMAGLWLLVDGLIARKLHPGLSLGVIAAAVGLALGLATLTRAVLLLFPLGVALGLGLVGWREKRRWLPYALALLLVYGATVSIWSVYNLQWGRIVIASDQFVPAFWRGAVADEGGHREVDESFLGESITDDGCDDCGIRIDEGAMLQDAAQTVQSDPLGFVRLRLVELAGSYLEPHGVAQLDGESLRRLALDWIGSGLSLSGLLRLVQGEQFWLKLVIYGFHYTGMIAGLAAIWRLRGRWRLMLPLAGFLLYTTLIHIVLIALPRYIFPTEAVFWTLAPVALLALWDRLFASHRAKQ